MGRVANGLPGQNRGVTALYWFNVGYAAFLNGEKNCPTGAPNKTSQKNMERGWNAAKKRHEVEKA